MELSKIKKFHDHFSIITVGESKIPNFPWKEYQSKKIAWEKFVQNYNYSGGIIKSDGEEIPPTTNFGIVTGYEHLECIDVDLKVFSTAAEQRQFWDEYLGHLRDNILDFDEKFVIYKTQSDGYHIIYKTKRVSGSEKLAKLKGHKEAVLETRGTGGYIFAYPDRKISQNDYFNIQYISDTDREIIMIFSRMYDYIEEKKEEPKGKKTTKFSDSDITPGDDFNRRHDIMDVVGDFFDIPPRGYKKNFTVLHTIGSKTPHSGYIYKDSGCMYLFSTGTPYPENTLISPFYAYAIKNHGGDKSAAASELYKKGYGSRIRKITEKATPTNTTLVESYNLNAKDLDFPIDIFPKPIQAYILECATKLNQSVDYMGCAMLWLISVCVGNTIKIRVKNGWEETASLWVFLVGAAGTSKTPSIMSVIEPLMRINNREIRRYIAELEKFNEYDKLDKKEKKDYAEVKKPKKTQFIVNDITLESLVDTHQDSKNVVGVFKDEVAGWVKDMNKYREGSDKEFWLSSWSGTSIAMNRMTRPGSFVEKPCIPVMGGIQPDIFSQIQTEENKSNGFMDRMLLCYPDFTPGHYNEDELDQDVITWYSDNIISFFDTLAFAQQQDINGEIIPYIATFDAAAKLEWVRIFNYLTDLQISDEENEYLKSMFPKQKSYVARFALILSVFSDHFNASDKDIRIIPKEAVLSAEKLSKYFIATAKKIKIGRVEKETLKNIVGGAKSNVEKIQIMYNENPDFNRSHAAEILGVSRQYIQNVVKKIDATRCN